MKSKSVFVGMKLDEMLQKKKIRALIVLPSCQEKDIQRYKQFQSQKNVKVLFYKGKQNLGLLLGHEHLKAFGIKDSHLGDALIAELEKE